MRIFILLAILLTSTGCESLTKASYSLKDAVQLKYQKIYIASLQVSQDQLLYTEFPLLLMSSDKAFRSSVVFPVYRPIILCNAFDGRVNFQTIYMLRHLETKNNEYFYTMELLGFEEMFDIQNYQLMKQNPNDLLNQVQEITSDVNCRFESIEDYNNAHFIIPKEEYIKHIKMIVEQINQS